MITQDETADLTTQIVDAAYMVHKTMGPGLLESVYHHCLIKELAMRKIQVESQVAIPLVYRGHVLNKQFVIDLLVEKQIILEIKAVELWNPVYEAQLLSYLKLTNTKIGYIINFNVPLIKHGIKRMKNGY